MRKSTKLQNNIKSQRLENKVIDITTFTIAISYSHCQKVCLLILTLALYLIIDI